MYYAYELLPRLKYLTLDSNKEDKLEWIGTTEQWKKVFLEIVFLEINNYENYEIN
jgi:hypothetical protein